MRDETHHLFNTKFGGVKLLEGYGATEAAPVVAVNHPDRNRPGSVGQLMPGMETRVEPGRGHRRAAGGCSCAGPMSWRAMSPPTTPRKVEPLEGGWHDTGDIVEIDDEDYITILGRVKRFAKIGGEMVSLSAVEGLASAVWPDHRHAVVSIPDTPQGREAGAGHRPARRRGRAIWRTGPASMARRNWRCPRRSSASAELPVLGTGKTDYVAIQTMVETDAKAA